MRESLPWRKSRLRRRGWPCSPPGRLLRGALGTRGSTGAQGCTSGEFLSCERDACAGRAVLGWCRRCLGSSGVLPGHRSRNSGISLAGFSRGGKSPQCDCCAAQSDSQDGRVGVGGGQGPGLLRHPQPSPLTARGRVASSGCMALAPVGLALIVRLPGFPLDFLGTFLIFTAAASTPTPPRTCLLGRPSYLVSTLVITLGRC